MNISVADQRILIFKDQISIEEAKERVWQKKTSFFDTFSKFGSLLSRPNDNDFELVYQEYRYQPFWHVIAAARYVYDRNNNYEIRVNDPEVTAITEQSNTFKVTNGHIHLPLTEHCVQEEQDEVFIDGVSGKNQINYKRYLSFSPHEVCGEIKIETGKDAIIVPPQTRISAIMRDALAKMIKGIQADKILEETVEVKCADLYYRPIYAFQFRWKSKSKEAIGEVDAVTGEVTTGNRIFNEYLGKVLDRDFLFDLGADAAGMLIPGGSMAVKIAKKYMDTRK